MQPNAIAATALKSTQSTVCASEQMASLVAVKTMGRVSTHGLSQHIHTESHSFGAFHTYGKQEVHYTDGVAAGEVDTGNSIWPFHPSHCRQMCLSCRYNIWTVVLGTSDARKFGLFEKIRKAYTMWHLNYRKE